jgi:hypothetical protein
VTGLLWMCCRIIIVEYCACRSVLNCQCWCWHWPRKFCRVSVRSIEMTGSSSWLGVGLGLGGGGGGGGGLGLGLGLG